jgi:hypothetical protein
MKLTSFTFFIFIFATLPMTGQEIIGRWVLEDVVFEGKSSKFTKQEIEEFRRQFLKENKRTLIDEYKSNGILCVFSVQEGDTTQFYESKWWEKGNTIYREGIQTGKTLHFTYKRNKSELYTQSYYPELDMVMKSKFLFVPGNSKKLYSDNTFASYAKAGVPALNKKWTVEEYRDAALALYDLEYRKVSILPHHNDSSFVILKKLTDCDSMEFLIPKEKITKTDVFYIASVLKLTLDIMLAYSTLGELKGKRYYSLENVMVKKAVLRLSDRGIEVVKELGVKEKETDKENIKKIIEGCLITFEDDHKFYRQEDLCSFYQTFSDFYGKYKNVFDAPQRKNFDGRLSTIKKKYVAPCLKKTH